MKACVKAWQEVISFSTKKIIQDENALRALNALLYGPAREIKVINDRIKKEMIEEFKRLYPDFKYDFLEIITDEKKSDNNEMNNSQLDC